MAATADTIPTIVGEAILESLQANLVYARLFNQDYQGDVKYGNAVKIPSIGSVSIGNYTVGSDMSDDTVSDSSATMSIDQQKYFSIVIDDVDAKQARPDIVGAYGREAAYQLRKTIDTYLASTLSSGAGLTTDLGTTGTPLEVTKDNVDTTLLQMAKLLDAADVPRQNRVVVLPPWMAHHLVQAGLSTFTDNVDVAQNGFVGRYAGFDVLMSSQVPNDTGAKYQVLAGSNIGATMAMQVNQTETIRHPVQMADKLRGLAVYGAKVTRANAIALAYCNDGSST
jgi:hypothetical protein